DGTLVLETDFTTDGGVVRITDCMPPRERTPHVVRVAECLRGQVPMRTDLVVRFNYGKTIPWIRTIEGAVVMIAGPDALFLSGDVQCSRRGSNVAGEFTLSAGQRTSFVLSWNPSHEPNPKRIDPMRQVSATERWWRKWSGDCKDASRWHDAVVRSLITL